MLSAEGIALTVRMTRSAMLDNLSQDFVRTLRAAGLSERRIYSNTCCATRCCQSSRSPAFRVGQIVGYALVVETIFGWPGVGQTLVNGVLRRDYPVVQFFSLLLVVVVTLGNLATASATRSPTRVCGSDSLVSDAPLLEIRDLTIGLRDENVGYDIVRDVNMVLYPNEILAVVGESGCGKSLTALSVLALHPSPPLHVTAGSIIFEGRDLTKLSRSDIRAIRGAEIAMVFQDPIERARSDVHGRHAAHLGGEGTSEGERRRRQGAGTPGAGRCRHRRPAPTLRRVSVPALRRHLPARDDRARPGERSEDHHRR